jgi:hypothetical protein
MTNTFDTISVPLTGSGIESHIGLADYHFGAVQAGNTASGTVAIHALSARQTTITDIRMADPTLFTFASATQLPTPSAPWVMLPGTSRILEIEFRPQSGGLAATGLIVTGDFSRCDDSVAFLSANGVSGVSAPTDRSGNRILRIDRVEGIRLELARAGVVSVETFNSAGERVTALQKEMGAGEGTIRVDAAAFAAGTYYVRVSSGAWSVVDRFVVH